MAAWVSRTWTENGKRRLNEVEPGLRGIKATDEFIVFWHHDGRTRQERVKLPGRNGKRIADAMVAKRSAEIQLGQYEAKDRQHWDQYRKQFSRVFLAGKSTATIELYNESYDLFEQICKPHLMSQISKMMVDEFRAALAKRRGRNPKSKASPATVNKYLRSLKVLLQAAHDDDVLPKMPKITFLREPEKMPQYMLPEHFDLIYSSCDVATIPEGRLYSAAQWWRALMVTGILTGMRISELMQLRRCDFDAERAIIQVHHDHTKGKRDEAIPIHEVAIRHLAELKGFGDLLFDWPKGKRRLYEEWHKIQTAAGIHLDCSEDHDHTDSCHLYGFHSLKMACGTMNANRLPQLALNAFMRHSSPATTAKFYRHAERAAAETLDAVFVPDSAKKPG